MAISQRGSPKYSSCIREDCLFQMFTFPVHEHVNKSHHQEASFVPLPPTSRKFGIKLLIQLMNSQWTYTAERYSTVFFDTSSLSRKMCI
uniref:Putative ovule protein n=1 Tax=Solanum chacoense TaxID=4108 RepID=A0A0V0H691_SOLCH